MDWPGADNYREHNYYIILCILVNSYIVGAVMSADKLKEFRITQTYTMQKEAYIYAESWEQAEEMAEYDDSIEWEINDSVLSGDTQIFQAEEV